jgi:hypothetical protein
MTTRSRDLTTPALYSQTRPSRGTVQASQSSALAEIANDAAGGHPAQRATVLRNEGGTFCCYIWPDTTAIYYAVRVTASWKTAPVFNASTVTLAVTDGTTTVGPGASVYLPRALLAPIHPGVSGARLDDFETREVFVQRDSLVAAGLSPSVPWRFTFVATTVGTYVEAIEIAPIGRTREAPAALAFSRMNRVTSGESFAGFVFGMQQIEVYPPSAAASAPVWIVSFHSSPGSRRCTWRSTHPGITH